MFPEYSLLWRNDRLLHAQKEPMAQGRIRLYPSSVMASEIPGALVYDFQLVDTHKSTYGVAVAVHLLVLHCFSGS